MTETEAPAVTHSRDDATPLQVTEEPEAPVQEDEVNAHTTNTAFRAPGLDKVRLIKKRKTWSFAPGQRLEHNLHWAIGLLELANSGDFAANIWNDLPVPVYAIVFMAIGGTAAGIISIYALRDAGRAWHNVKFLRKQREQLESQLSQQTEERQSTQELQVLLDMTKRELYNEMINRWGMDILTGGGAVLISIGTFLALGGANRKVFLASNILSGYLGNAPIAIFGVINFIWAMRMWSTKKHHSRAAKANLQDPIASSLVRRYSFDVQLFFAINGPSSLIGGVGSMLTATQWWAYIILIPVIICSYFSNYWWRRRAGYERPFLHFPTGMDTKGLVQILEFSEETRKLIEKHPEAAMSQLVPDPTSLAMVLHEFVEHGLFEEFSVSLTKNKCIHQILCNTKTKEVDIEASTLLRLSDEHQAMILDVAGQYLRDEGPKHFQHRTRFISEVLGTYLAMGGAEQPSAEEEGREKTAEKTESPPSSHML